jgi:hypothetical protein
VQTVCKARQATDFALVPVGNQETKVCKGRVELYMGAEDGKVRQEMDLEQI